MYYLTLIFVIFLTLLTFSSSQQFSCNIRNGNCSVNEVCLFRMAQTTNSHAAFCNQTSYSYAVCCNTIKYSSIKTSCSSDEGGIISLLKEIDSHVEKYNYSNYPYHVCAKFDIGSPVATYIRDGFCFSNETIVASIYKLTNSHVAEPNYYNKKICISKYSDILLNGSSLIFNNSNPVVGDVVNITIKVFNIGEVDTFNVNITCYDNSNLFDYYVVNNVPAGGYSYAYCIWRTSCNVNHTLEFYADEQNKIFEYNESNNYIRRNITLMEKLSIRIDNPKNGDSFYRGQIINLNSTVSASCNPVSNYNVYWYNNSVLIGIGEDITWQIPLDDGLLGNKTIEALVNKSGYIEGRDSVNITILNNPPSTNINLDKNEVEVGDSITVSCLDVNDVEDPVEQLKVNVSILYPDNTWSNSSASRISTTNNFYKIVNIPFNAPLGVAKAFCAVKDTDNGYFEISKDFIIYQNVTILISLNKTNYWWGEGVGSYIKVVRRDGSLVTNASINVSLNEVIKCSGKTNNNGEFLCDFTAPLEVGIFKLSVVIQDPKSTKLFSNSTNVEVVLTIGEDIEKAKIVSCHEEPRLIQNPDGTISRVIIKVCIVRK